LLQVKVGSTFSSHLSFAFHNFAIYIFLSLPPCSLTLSHSLLPSVISFTFTSLIQMLELFQNLAFFKKRQEIF